jgi:hypothetical protein
MALINMKHSRDEAKKYVESDVSDEPQYPYGLCIDLGKDELEKLGINALPKVGAEMKIMAVAYVKSTSAYETQSEGKDMRVSLQITDMAIEGTTSGERQASAASGLYGDTMLG